MAGLKRKANQTSGVSFGSAISRASAASGASADSNVRHVTYHDGLSPHWHLLMACHYTGMCHVVNFSLDYGIC